MADIEYLKGLKAVRERAQLVLKAAEQDELTHFSYSPELMPKVADYVSGIINVCSNSDNKPELHGLTVDF